MKMHHVALTVSDLDKTIAFYCSIFGFKVLNKFERKDLKGKACFIGLETFKLELW